MAQFLCCSGLLRRLRRGGAWIWSTISANCGHHRSTTGPLQYHKRIMVSGGSTECAKNERRLSWAGPPKAGPAKAGAPQLSPSCPTCHQQGSTGRIRGAKHLFICATAPLLGNTNTSNFGNTQHSFGGSTISDPYFQNTTKVDFCRKSLRRQSSTTQLTSVSLCHEYVPFVKKSIKGLLIYSNHVCHHF